MTQGTSYLNTENWKTSFSLPASALKMSPNILPISMGICPSVWLKLWAGSPKSEHAGQEHMKTFLRKKQHFSLFGWDNVLFLLRNHRNCKWTLCIGSSNLPSREGTGCYSSFNSLPVKRGDSSGGFHHTLWPRLCAPSQYHRSVAVTLERTGKRTSIKNICCGGRLKEVNSVHKCGNWTRVRGTIFLDVETSRVS